MWWPISSMLPLVMNQNRRTEMTFIRSKYNCLLLVILVGFVVGCDSIRSQAQKSNQIAEQEARDMEAEMLAHRDAAQAAAESGRVLVAVMTATADNKAHGPRMASRSMQTSQDSRPAITPSTSISLAIYARTMARARVATTTPRDTIMPCPVPRCVTPEISAT